MGMDSSSSYQMDSGVRSRIDDDTNFCVTTNSTSSFVHSLSHLFSRCYFRELDGLFFDSLLVFVVVG